MKSYRNHKPLRKNFLVYLLAAGLLFTAVAAESETVPVKMKAVPFDLKEVSLRKSVFTANRDRTIAYLKYLNPDRLLHNFRVAAGLPSSAAPMGGWEKPDCKLRGHSMGHVLSALAQAWAGSGDLQLKTKLDLLVAELGKCQDAMEKRGSPPGFLSAYDVAQFERLEELTPYPQIWAPYYTLHKILAGLVAAHRLAGNDPALNIAEKIAGWVGRRLNRVPESRLQEMWNLYIAGEYGGMNEVLAELNALTGKREYLETARLFDKRRLLEPMQNNRNKLAGLHANQHIPQVLGYLRIHELSGDPMYLKAAGNFWRMVTAHHAYVIGGVSEAEMFREPDRLASYLTEKTCETCCAYNMLKLTRQLFQNDPRAHYMDYYERTLFNQILASQDPLDKHSAVTYFMPLNPGARKTYSNEYEDFSCCHGTGMENHTKYQDSIFFRSAGGDTLYVNLYIPAVLDWKEKGFRIVQETDFPCSGQVKLTVSGQGRLRVKLRIPAWAGEDIVLRVNGRIPNLKKTPGTYVILDRRWRSGDVIQLGFPVRLRLQRLPDIPDIVSILAGPILLVGVSDSHEWIHLDLDPENLERDIVSTGNPLEFRVKDLTLVPMYKAHHHGYHSHFIMHGSRERD